MLSPKNKHCIKFDLQETGNKKMPRYFRNDVCNQEYVNRSEKHACAVQGRKRLSQKQTFLRKTRRCKSNSEEAGGKGSVRQTFFDSSKLVLCIIVRGIKSRLCGGFQPSSRRGYVHVHVRVHVQLITSLHTARPTFYLKHIVSLLVTSMTRVNRFNLNWISFRVGRGFRSLEHRGL